jgi:Right handed beta helix region
VTIAGAPTTDVRVGNGAPAGAGITERVVIRDSNLSGGRRDVVTASGAIRLSIERNVISGAKALPRGEPGAGIHIRAGDRGQPTLSVKIADNTIVDNAGPGIYADLAPRNGLPVFASGIEISGNIILRNARTAAPATRGGIVLLGGQDGGRGTMRVVDNAIRGNRGPGILERRLSLVLDAERNDLRGNSAGTIKGTRARPPAAPNPATWTPQLTTVDGPRDDTSWLQERLDSGGGTIFLPKLPNGQCYAARGLWVSHDDTTIDSDGACIVSLGPGEVRLKSNDGDPIASSGVFFINRSSPKKPAPIRITISNLRIIVPQTVSMYGVAVAGHDVTLDHLQIGGYPRDDVLIGGRANGNGYTGNVAVLDSTLSGAKRNAISAFGVINLRIEGNTVQGVRDSPPGQPAAGIDVEPDDRGQPTLGVRILHNTFQDNAGPGILFELDSNSGPAELASDLEIRNNTVVRNALARTPPKRAGIVIAGGEDGGQGTLALTGNVVHDNGGPGILMLRLKLLVQASGNDVSGNQDNSG